MCCQCKGWWLGPWRILAWFCLDAYCFCMELLGTEKQVSYAVAIRDRILVDLDERIAVATKRVAAAGSTGGEWAEKLVELQQDRVLLLGVREPRGGLISEAPICVRSATRSQSARPLVSVSSKTRSETDAAWVIS
jgi:hypothetical protein